MSAKGKMEEVGKPFSEEEEVGKPFSEEEEVGKPFSEEELVPHSAYGKRDLMVVMENGYDGVDDGEVFSKEALTLL